MVRSSLVSHYTFITDAEKQDAINLFLGNYVPEEGKPPLWELSSDYHLHNEDPRMRTKRRQ